MRLYEFLKLYLQIKDEDIPLDMDKKQLADFGVHSDAEILSKLVEQRVHSQKISIINGKPSQPLEPALSDYQQYISSCIKDESDYLSKILEAIQSLIQNGKPKLATVYDVLIQKYHKDFVSHFQYDEIGRKEGYGYSQTLEIGSGQNPSALYLRNGRLESGKTSHYGWKFHISLEDSITTKDDRGHKENVEQAWNALLPVFFKHQVNRVKVFTSSIITDEANNDPSTVGKQITIYANQFSKDPEQAKQLIHDITKTLIENDISPSYCPVGDKAVIGSSYIAYRYDTYHPDHERHGKRRTGPPYMPDRVSDPFQGITLTFPNQKVSPGEKVTDSAVATTFSSAEATTPSVRPNIPPLNLGQSSCSSGQNSLQSTSSGDNSSQGRTFTGPNPFGEN